MSKVVLITGASSGIGYAAALAFARAGYQVAGVARRLDRLQQLADEVAALPTPHGEFLPVAGDVTRAEDMQNAVAQTVARFGRLDVLVANAGLGQILWLGLFGVAIKPSQSGSKSSPSASQ